jgi:ribonuclease Z
MMKIQIKIAAILALAVFVAPFLFSKESAATGVRKGVYYPNTEKLAPDEMRIISLGTGLPTPLTKTQKSSSWLVELGNWDIFVFDCGTGSIENMLALQPRFAVVDKVFVSHLHTDHVGDVDAL